MDGGELIMPQENLMAVSARHDSLPYDAVKKRWQKPFDRRMC